MTDDPAGSRPRDASGYRFSAAFVVRLMGLGLAVVGLLVLVLALLVAFAGAPAPVLWAGFAVLVGLLGGTLLLRRTTVVRLGPAGYRVRLVRGAGVSAAAWREVEDVTAATVAGERCVVLRLRDGRSTTLPVDVLAGSTDDFVRDLQQHLDRGHGYQGLPRRGR